jgi:hypothetical protein
MIEKNNTLPMSSLHHPVLRMPNNTDRIQSNEQGKVAVKELAIPLGKVISTVPSVIEIECVLLFTRIPALNVFSVICRHISIVIMREE